MKQHKLLPSQFFSFYMELYPFILRFSVNQTLEEICNEDHIDDTDDFTVSLISACTTPGRIIPFEDSVYLCVLKRFDTSPSSHGVFAHEALHLMNFIVEKIGAKLCTDNDEFCCYMLGYITEKFYENLKY